MITEDYVSFETAKILKEKGFDEPFYFFYRTDDRIIHHVVRAKPLVYDNTIDDEVISAPTLQTAMKWLREEHDIFILICRAMVANGYEYYHEIYNGGIAKYAQYGRTYLTYAEACEVAIKYCLENLI